MNALRTKPMLSWYKLLPWLIVAACIAALWLFADAECVQHYGACKE